jgi:hypothetical protein
MSRSRKKMPIVGITTARSDQSYKSDEHRRERRTVRADLDLDDPFKAGAQRRGGVAPVPQ